MTMPVIRPIAKGARGTASRIERWSLLNPDAVSGPPSVGLSSVNWLPVGSDSVVAMPESIMRSVIDTPVQANSASAATPELSASSRPGAVLRVNPACDARNYFDSESPQWQRLEFDPRATLIKQGKNRSVWRVVFRGEAVYAKVFDDRAWSLSSFIKRILGAHPARREWRALMKMECRSVPAIRAIGLAKYGRVGAVNRMVLLTQGIEMSKTLMNIWEETGRSVDREAITRRRSIVIAVAELWAVSHLRGYVHPDPHPANVLIQKTSGESHATAFFLDPTPGPWPGFGAGAVSLKTSLRSLAMLDQYFHRRASRSDRLRFWREYWLRRKELLSSSTERLLLADFVRSRETHNLILARRRDRRLSGDGKYFDRVHLGGGWSGRVALRLERRHVFEERAVPDRTVSEWNSICSEFIRTRDSEALETRGVRAVRRPVNRRGAWAQEKFERSHLLRHRDIAAPLILGYLQLRNLGSIRDEYLLLPVP